MTPVYGQTGEIIGYNFTDKELDIPEIEEILGDRVHYLVNSVTEELTYVSKDAEQKCADLANTIIKKLTGKNMKDESHLPIEQQSLVFRLRKRAEIRSQIKDRKSVQENRPDRIAELLLEAAQELERKSTKRDKFLVWINELEGFTLKSERLYNDLDTMIQQGKIDMNRVLTWLHAAYLQGQNDE